MKFNYTNHEIYTTIWLETNQANCIEFMFYDGELDHIWIDRGLTNEHEITNLVCDSLNGYWFNIDDGFFNLAYIQNQALSVAEKLIEQAQADAKAEAAYEDEVRSSYNEDRI